MSPSDLDCLQIQAYLPLFVGEDLDPPLNVQVGAHLQRCAGCSQDLSALRAALASFVVERERVDARVDLWPGLERELARTGSITTPAAPSSAAAARRSVLAASALPATAPIAAPARATWLRRATVLAAAAGLALVAWRWTQDSSPSRSSPTGAVQGEVAVRESRPLGSAAQQSARSESADSDSAGSPRTSVGRDATAPGGERLLRGPVVPGPGASSGDFALVGESNSSVVVGDSVDMDGSAEPGASKPLDPAAGLRRVPRGEALLRHSIDARSDYSLAGSRGLR